MTVKYGGRQVTGSSHSSALQKCRAEVGTVDADGLMSRVGRVAQLDISICQDHSTPA